MDTIIVHRSSMTELAAKIDEATVFRNSLSDPHGSNSSGRRPSGHSRDPIPHFPFGELAHAECGICLESKMLNKRPCCGFPACGQCLSTYFATKVQLQQVSISCVNTDCDCFAHRDEISVRLESALKDTYHRLLLASNSDGLSKTCPLCNSVYSLPSSDALKRMRRDLKREPNNSRVECESCGYSWCFLCHSPWHAPVSCAQFQKGDRLLLNWARQVSQGQINAQKCPNCKIFIQRSSGCDHMHCTRCKTDFCYRCGDRLRRLKFFGDHYSKLSIFGCKYRYKANQPVQRKLVRGAVFGSKVCMAPVLGTLAVCAGALIVGVGVAALPLYGGVQLYRNYQRKRYFKVTLTGNNNNTKSGAAGPTGRQCFGKFESRPERIFVHDQAPRVLTDPNDSDDGTDSTTESTNEITTTKPDEQTNEPTTSKLN